MGKRKIDRLLDEATESACDAVSMVLCELAWDFDKVLNDTPRGMCRVLTVGVRLLVDVAKVRANFLAMRTKERTDAHKQRAINKLNTAKAELEKIQKQLLERENHRRCKELLMKTVGTQHPTKDTQ